jgi:hypothetical protein
VPLTITLSVGTQSRHNALVLIRKHAFGGQGGLITTDPTNASSGRSVTILYLCTCSQAHGSESLTTASAWLMAACGSLFAATFITSGSVHTKAISISTSSSPR